MNVERTDNRCDNEDRLHDDRGEQLLDVGVHVADDDLVLAEELLRLLQAAQFVAEHGDQVCPAKWQPGAETLKPSLDLVGQL